MDDAEMIELIRSELNRNVSDEEADYYGAQCGADYAQVYLGRIERILAGQDPTNYRSAIERRI